MEDGALENESVVKEDVETDGNIAKNKDQDKTK
jgi:hypothetical protein